MAKIRKTFVALIAMLLLPMAANAGLISYTGSIETWVVDTSGTYSITAVGAQGASGSSTYVGGRGASITGLFDLIAGDIYYFAVGGAGSSLANDSGNGGGGGGSFFVDVLGIPLLIAGGGGGTRASVSQNGCDASITEFGVRGSGSSPASSCTVKTNAAGLGGIASSSSWGGGGAGFYGDGAVDGSSSAAKSWANGLTGGIPFSDVFSGAGGFGGGGSGAGSWGGGGGGGYSGGDGGRVAGGGGSWNTGYSQVALAGVGIGNGSLSWELIGSNQVPTPATIALFVLGLVGLGWSRRKIV